MERFCFFAAGIFVFLFALWFISAIFRIRRSPAQVLRKWQRMTPEELERCARLCEMFFREELKMPASLESLSCSMPCLLNLFPTGIARLKGYLKYGTSRKKHALIRSGEYFYGFGSILVAAFIGETLRRSCGAVWQMSSSGPLLLIPGAPGKQTVTLSPIHKMVKLRNVLSQAEKEEFEEYLHCLCLMCPPGTP